MSYNVLTQGVLKYQEFGEDCPQGMDDPSEDDYQVYMIFNFIKSLSTEKKSLINHSLNFVEVYYSLIDLIFESSCKLNDYHFEWFD